MGKLAVFLNICNYYSLYVGMTMCGCVHMNAGAGRDQKIELDFLELESQACRI